MIPLKDNQDVASFLVTKHSWKGKYKRVFSVGTHGITTYNPDRLEVTNKWLYADVVTIASAKHSNSVANHDFTLVMKKDKKVDSMKFSSEHKCLILTEAFKYRHLFSEKPKDVFRYQAYKHHWSGTRLPVVLEVGPCALDQLDPSTHTILASYPYCDIQGVLPVRDVSGGFVLAVGGYSRLHLFSNAMDHQIIINKMMETSNLILSSNIKWRPASDLDERVHSPQSEPRASYGADAADTLLGCITSFATRWSAISGAERRARSVYPHAPRVPSRTAPSVCGRGNGVQPSQRLFAENKEKLITGALSALVNSSPTANLPPRELEAQFHALRRLCASKVGFAAFTTLPGFREWIGGGVVGALRRGGAACAPAALDAVCALMQPMHQEPDLRQEQLNKASMLSSPAFLDSLLSMWAEHVVLYYLFYTAALDAVCALMQPMHQEPDLCQEQLNKASMLSSPAFLDSLLSIGALVVAAMLDFLTFALCVPYSETTDGKQFDQLLEMVANKGRVLFKLFEHPSMAIVKGAGLVMRALVEEGGASVGSRMQALALAEAALPRHLLTALYAAAADGTKLHRRHLARHLVALWLRPVVLRRRRERLKSTANWPMFYYQFHRDHALPNLIWNHTFKGAM
ncbi:putative DnaJ-like protein [Operophtera brumata]|uniref:Putative DnaJ-like protein n=1 Tax=Operophtera brumata TaxID=104452 RepID=A0A0L7KTC3_OPEBR|nr:putative DnaJ-like protein [Operophtera brumata]